MTSKIVVNNIESDAGISSVTLVSNIAGEDSTQNISGINSVTATSFHGSSVTATTFHGSGANLTGIDATSIKDSSGNVKIQGNNSGATVTGVITAVGGNSTEGAFLKGTAVGVGTTTNAGLAAGVGTASGTLTFNTTVGLQCYMGDAVGWKNVASFVTATGGSKSTAAGKTIHTFTSSGAFTLTDGAPTCDILIVGGGGAGGQDVAGGGGAGGMVEGTITLPGPGTYPVTVGDGGSNASTGGDTPAPGGNSSWTVPVGTITAAGGGAGMVGNDVARGETGTDDIFGQAKQHGGSGGGKGNGYTSNTESGVGTPGQGHRGSRGASTWNYNAVSSGGGGGAGSEAEFVAAASYPTGSTEGANGGSGVTSSITGSAVGRAGGGGGGSYGNNPGTGSDGGGTGANNNSAGNAGTANTGGGGGGAASNSSSTTVAGGNGGSGVVIISYDSSLGTLANDGSSGGLTVSTSTSGSKRIYEFTAGTGTITF